VKIENRMATAGKVLRVVRKLVKDSNFVTTLSLGAYQNGREQGYSLWSNIQVAVAPAKYKQTFVCWSESRASDQIVVYVSDLDPMQSITEKMYRNARFFRHDEIEQAARFVISQFPE
jgi:hypothetical protein